MAKAPEILVIRGRELTVPELETIHQVRVNAFGEREPIVPTPGNEDWERIFFLAKRGDELLAFGRLYEDIEVSLLGESYSIYGTGSLYAVTRGLGHGPLITEAMNEYVREHNKTSVGFNFPEMSPYYQKFGRGIMSGGAQRFIHPSVPSKYPNEDANYLEGPDGLIEQMLRFPSTVATISRPQW